MSQTSAAPLVTVVVPAYNASRTLPATLASIGAQTLNDLEVIVVDDGSTDDTVEVAMRSHARDLRVISQENAGHAAARNAGIAAAHGRYIAFLDADDLWLPEKLERQLEVLQGDPEIRALQSGAARVDDDLNTLWLEECCPSDDQLWDALCFRNMPALMSTLILEWSLLEEIGGFDSSLVILQDWDLAIRLARRDQLHCVPDALTAYRFHASQSADVGIHVEPGLRVLEALFADPELPAAIQARRGEIYARFYAMLSGGSLKVRRVWPALYWAVRAFIRDPRIGGYLAAFPARRIRRRRQPAAKRKPLPLPASVLEANYAAQGGVRRSGVPAARGRET